MAYLLETEISNTKSLIFSLSAIYGLGHEQSRIICRKLGYAENLSFSNLTKSQIISLQCFLKNSGLILSNDAKKRRSILLQQKIRIKLRRGLRFVRGLPVRGQRTHTNAKTAKRLRKNRLRDSLF